MMISILLDSSNTDLFVGLLENGQPFDSVFYECWQLQSEYMIVELNKMLEKHAINKESVQEIIVSNGPGSYTGVRIAITIAKIFGVSIKCKVLPVSSLRILADFDSMSACVINARNGRSFFGVYHKEKVIVEDCIKTNEEVAQYLDENPNCILCGDTKYLGLQGFKANPIATISRLRDSLECVDPLSLKPIYMKD